MTGAAAARPCPPGRAVRAARAGRGAAWWRLRRRAAAARVRPEGSGWAVWGVHGGSGAHGVSIGDTVAVPAPCAARRPRDALLALATRGPRCKGMVWPPGPLWAHGVMLAGEWRGAAREEGDRGSGRMKGYGCGAVGQGQVQHREGSGMSHQELPACLRTWLG